MSAVMECLKALHKAGARIAVVVWGGSIPEAEALRLLQAGAAGGVCQTAARHPPFCCLRAGGGGVIPKTASRHSLLRRRRSVGSGTTWMEEDLRREPDRPVRLARSPLTARELQVMELVERGMKNKDIGTALGIRTGTVKIHLKHIFEKTGIRGRYGLALSGLKEKGLL